MVEQLQVECYTSHNYTYKCTCTYMYIIVRYWNDLLYILPVLSVYHRNGIPEKLSTDKPGLLSPTGVQNSDLTKVRFN